MIGRYIYIVQGEPESGRCNGKILVVTHDMKLAYETAKSYIIKMNNEEHKFTQAEKDLEPLKFCERFMSAWLWCPEITRKKIK